MLNTLVIVRWSNVVWSRTVVVEYGETLEKKPEEEQSEERQN